MGWNNDITRRDFLYQMSMTSALFLMPKFLSSQTTADSRIYISQNGTAYQNVEKVVELMGGMEAIIGRHDIVVLKPNCQWWNQGTTNVSAMRRFIELVLEMPGFDGEVIIAENHQKYVANERGWTYPNVINGDPDAINLNALLALFHERGYSNVTKYHWINQDYPGGRIVSGPAEGDGYVHTDIVYSYEGLETIMTYPIFSSAYSGRRIDLRYGVWSDGQYTDPPVKLINFSVLNDHWMGVTSSVKNLMGVVELPGNDYGMFPEGYYNFHSIGNEKGRQAMGGAIGTFLQTIRKPDLNIVTAEWVGWGGRVTPELAVQAKTILASTDPVALDFWSSKYVLLPFTPDDYVKKHYHDPERTDREFYKYLNECHQQGVGTMNEDQMLVDLYDFNASTNIDFVNKTATSVLVIGQNHPNPFNGITQIPFYLKKDATVRIVIRNILGQIVRVITDNRVISKGRHFVSWDGRNSQNKSVPSGTYICEFTHDRNSCYKKLILVR